MSTDKRPMNPEDQVARLLAAPPPRGWTPTGRTRSAYLDLMEAILRIAATWQDEHGAIIDPVEKAEHAQTSCRFVAPGAILLAAGRGEALREKVYRGMDWCCRRLSAGEGKSPDFWMRELMTAWNLLGDAPPARRATWERQIRSIDPESIYWAVSRDGSKLADLHNWTVYAAAGEAMRQQAGLGPTPDDGTIVWGRRFFDKYMPPQLRHFSDLGMYRDPNDPFTYDMTTRLQIAVALASGIDTPLRGPYDDLLRRGALAQLLYVSPEGHAPFGGRSNQMNLQEAILAALCEIEAVRYRDSNPRLAFAFKRQAHLHAAAIGRWILETTPPRHIKNRFDLSTRHGCEDYAKWSVYSLFAASCLGLAWQFADDTIAEAPSPAEIGGYVLELQLAFHKIIANCAGTQVEIDTAGDPHYDATGLGRFCRAGVPPELGLAMPFASQLKYIVPPDLVPQTELAIGPAWQVAGVWADLAPQRDGLAATCSTTSATSEHVSFAVIWTLDAAGVTVRQDYTLRAGELHIVATVTHATQLVDRIRFTVPALVTDGGDTTRIDLAPGSLAVHHPAGTYRATFDPACTAAFGRDIANRNGIYRPLILETPGNSMTITLALTGARG